MGRFAWVCHLNDSLPRSNGCTDMSVVVELEFGFMIFSVDVGELDGGELPPQFKALKSNFLLKDCDLGILFSWLASIFYISHISRTKLPTSSWGSGAWNFAISGSGQTRSPPPHSRCLKLGGVYFRHPPINTAVIDNGIVQRSPMGLWRFPAHARTPRLPPDPSLADSCCMSCHLKVTNLLLL